MGDKEAPEQLRFVFLLAEIASVFTFVGVGFYVFLGFGWDTFPNHPWFMVTALVLVQGHALMSFRMPCSIGKGSKCVHMILHFVTVILATIGLWNIVQNNTFGSVHSILGATVLVLFLTQLVLGFGGKFYPGLGAAMSDWYKPVHAVCGAAVFVLACGTALTGLAHQVPINGGEASFAYTLSRLSALTIIVFASCVIFILINPKFESSSKGSAEEQLFGMESGRASMIENQKSYEALDNSESKKSYRD